jgi:hypothetical protein
MSRRRRTLLLAIAATGLAAIGIRSLGGDSPKTAHSRLKTILVAGRGHALPAPISGESVVALPEGPLILGGLDATEASVSGVFQLDAETSRLRQAGELNAPLHDAAAVALGNRILIFGGGADASTDEVQGMEAPGARIPAGTVAGAVGRLPTARSDLSAVQVGGRAYLLGG